MADANQPTWQFDNTFIPNYTPNNLKWYEKDGLETWYRQNKCNEFLSNTKELFQKRKIVNFVHYPEHFQEQIYCSIFCNSNRKDMHIQKETIKEHFQNKNVSVGRGRFLKTN